ncbi:MAG: hypothetical protein ACRCSP_00320 [Rhodoglobus sp.]
MTTLLKLKYAARPIELRMEARELPLMSVSMRLGVVRRSEITSDLPRADDLSNYRVCERGDLVINRMSAYQGALGRAKESGVVSPDYLVLRFMQDVEPRYGEYLFLSQFMISEMTSLLRGVGSVGLGTVRTPRVNWSDLGGLLIEWPEHKIQRQIADYLDAQTAKIDALIGKQERLIETLAERRQAVISHAVTKGLDPTAPMKDSGVEWIGQLPSHWTLPRVGHSFGITLGKMVNEGKVGEPSAVETPYLRAGNVQSYGIDTSVVKTMPMTADDIAHLSLVVGDLVVVEGGQGGYGRSALVLEDLTGWGFQNHVMRVRPANNDLNGFLDYVIKTLRANGHIASLSSHASLPSFSSEKLGAIRYGRPPLAEQREIAAHLDHETSQIDALSSKAREMIVVLKERRQALISAAVTGTIDVRGLV